MNSRDEFYNISSEIISELGPILSTRPYLAIVDFEGKFRYIESEMEKYTEFITDFVISNFRFLEIGDHSMPISGTNLAFFKLSKKAIITIYIKKGLIGQLLIFKNLMMKYQLKIDSLILEEPPEKSVTPVDLFQESQIIGKISELQPEPKAEPPKAAVVPILLKKIGKKAKFPLQEVVILNYCDGKNTIKDITREGNIKRWAVWSILNKYKKKGWVDITYTGNPTFHPVLTKEIPAMAVQLGIVNKKEFEISKLCNGDNTIKDIQQALGIDQDEIEDTIKKMEKNNIIHLEIQ
ncbi:MAG: hypothetical protein HWN66_14255 [Candidatus Helarchaeota archaeon]|nr:hypothetical protein [Candidatus Helarchaeota archaeon]